MSERDWAQERREAADVHADRLARNQRAEHERAAHLLREFASVARGRLPVESLRARGSGGRGSAPTDVAGWYLRKDRTAGMNTEGEFFVLTAPVRLRDRFTGVQLRPTSPPMVLGAGGKDGQSLDLPDALERLFPGWRTFLPGS